MGDELERGPNNSMSDSSNQDLEFEDLDGFENWRNEGEDALTDMKDTKDRDEGLQSGRQGRRQRALSSARDIHGFELRKEQVENYKKFEPLLREEERERISRWERFAEEYAPKDAGPSKSGDGDLDNLVNSVNFVLRSRRGTDGEESPGIDMATRELRMLVQSGIPNQARGVLWQAFLQVEQDAQSHQASASSDAGSGESRLGGLSWGSLEAYEYLCSDGNFDQTITGEEDPSLAYLKLIGKDIPRTLPTHKQARQFGESGSLRRVLKAYCRHHPVVGYCQGMNFVAGLFLIILTNTRTLSGVGGKQAAGENGETHKGTSASGELLLESNCYWCFDSLCTKVLARYYSEDMVELQVDQLVMQQLLEEKFPTVATQMDNLGVSLACVSSSWLLCGFANALPWTTLLRTWDVLLFPDVEEDCGAFADAMMANKPVESSINKAQSTLLFKFTLALVDIHSRSLIQCKDPTQLIVLLQSMAVQSFDSSQLVTIACQGFSDVNENKLEPYRQLYRPIVSATFGHGKKVSDPVSSYTDPMGGSSHHGMDTPEAAKVRDKLGLRSIDNGASSHQEEDDIIDMGKVSSRSNASTASGSASARLLRRRFLGSHSSFGLLSPFGRNNNVRRSASTGIPQGVGTSVSAHRNSDPGLQQENMNEQIMQLTSVRYYLEKQVVDLIGIVARMNKEMREKEHKRSEEVKSLKEVEGQNLKLLGSVDALEKELTQKVESLKAKDDLAYMLQEKISKQSLEISLKDKQITELRHQSDSPKAKLSAQFSQLKQNIFHRGKNKVPTASSSESDSDKKVDDKESTP